jgi:hypothetical protein
VFGIETADGTVYKLDDVGNSKAFATLREDPSKTNVTVGGSLRGRTMYVDSIDLY